jgi:membrane protease YdiL (CAAX protease family)
MNDCPVIPRLVAARRTAASSFRCRRRMFGRPFSVVLFLLTALLLATFFVHRHNGHELRYERSCVQSMDSTVLMLIHWESAPASSRWLTGFTSRDQFFEGLQMHADAARRDGYFSDHIAVRMVLACLIFDRPAEARAWGRSLTDSGIIEWSNLLLSSAPGNETAEEFVRAMMEETITASTGTGMTDTAPKAAARNIYIAAVRTNAIALGVCCTGLPFLGTVLRLLMRRGHAPRRHAARLEKLWNPIRAGGAWLRAEWLFLFHGLVLIALGGLAFLAWDAGGDGLAAKAGIWFLTMLGELGNSLLANVVYVILMTGPVLLMVRWLTPGFHSTLRIFGIRRCPLRRGAFWRVTLAGLTLVGLLYLSFGFLTSSLGIFDPRDGWSLDGEALWLQILIGCVVAPFMEEFIYRGFLFTAWSNSRGPWMAAICSSFLFAIIHGYSLEGTVLVACFGMLMCALYHRTGTLLVPMTIHAATNGLLIL